MPSHFEAYGIALIEALACGVPCVARDVCAVPEILKVTNGVGWSTRATRKNSLP